MNALKKTTLNWLAALASVWMVVTMSAAPVLAAAVIAANSVNSPAIINGQVKTVDLGKGAVTAKKIKKGAVTGAKIRNRTIKNADIAAAAAIADSKIKYSTKTKYLSIPAVAFVPAKNDLVYQKAGNGWLAAYPGSGAAIFCAPVSLPDGAKIIELEYEYLDNHATHYTQAELFVSATDGYSSMALVQSSGPFASPDWQTGSDGTITRPDINNLKYDYYVMLRLHELAGSQLKAARVLIAYQVTGP